MFLPQVMDIFLDLATLIRLIQFVLSFYHKLFNLDWLPSWPHDHSQLDLDLVVAHKLQRFRHSLLLESATR